VKLERLRLPNPSSPSENSLVNKFNIIRQIRAVGATRVAEQGYCLLEKLQFIPPKAFGVLFVTEASKHNTAFLQPNDFRYNHRVQFLLKHHGFLAGSVGAGIRQCAS